MVIDTYICKKIKMKCQNLINKRRVNRFIKKKDFLQKKTVNILFLSTIINKKKSNKYSLKHYFEKKITIRLSDHFV